MEAISFQYRRGAGTLGVWRLMPETVENRLTERTYIEWTHVHVMIVGAAVRELTCPLFGPGLVRLETHVGHKANWEMVLQCLEMWKDQAVGVGYPSPQLVDSIRLRVALGLSEE